MYSIFFFLVMVAMGIPQFCSSESCGLQSAQMMEMIGLYIQLSPMTFQCAMKLGDKGLFYIPYFKTQALKHVLFSTDRALCSDGVV